MDATATLDSRVFHLPRTWEKESVRTYVEALQVKLISEHSFSLK